MAITLLAHAPITNNGTVAQTAPFDSTGCNKIVVTLVHANGGSSGPTDSLGNSWSQAGASTGDSFCTNRVVYCDNPITSPTHVISMTNAAVYAPSGCVTCLAGAQAGYDGDNLGAASTSSTTIQPGNYTPSQDDCLVITTIGISGGATLTGTINGGFALSDQVPFSTGNNYGNACGYLIQTTAALTNPTYTLGGTPLSMSAKTVAFRAATSYSLTAAYGSFVETGKAASFGLTRGLRASPGQFVLTGRPVNLPSQPHAMVCAVGHFVLTGEAATLNKVKLLVCATGHFTLTGEGATLDIDPTWDPACDCDLLTDPWSKVAC
jgi:hypothetical protein